MIDAGLASLGEADENCRRVCRRL